MLFKKIIPASKITFESFLSGVPARDYVFQSTTSYDEQIKQAAEMIKEMIIAVDPQEEIIPIHTECREAFMDLEIGKILKKRIRL